MTDNDVEIAVRKQLLAQLAQAGIDIPVKAGFQSAKQGREDNFVMFFPVGENPQGWQRRSYNPQGSDAGHLEAQQYETTFQVQAFITEFSGYTAKDITSIVRMIVNSLPFVEALRKQGIGVQRATGSLWLCSLNPAVGITLNRHTVSRFIT